MFGEFSTAIVHVQCILALLTTNQQGYFALPEHFEGRTPSGTLTAEEGTAELVMNLVMLWQRLCRVDFGQSPIDTYANTCTQIIDFLSDSRSPVEFWVERGETKR